MISEELQDQAALYVLGSLDRSEAIAFEKSVADDPELEKLLRELRDSVAALAYVAPAIPAPPQLKARILNQITKPDEISSSRRRAPAFATWLPWTIAAVLVLFCGLLALDRARLQRQLSAAYSADPLSSTLVVPLAPTPEARAPSKGSVVWEPDRQTGVVKLVNMPVAGAGKDYQLWIVDAEHKAPISAGIIRVDPQGNAEWRFLPAETARHIKAFAISVERKGGVPVKEGPIVMIGSV